jgi:sugar phosphate isomerase/epimerase
VSAQAVSTAPIGLCGDLIPADPAAIDDAVAARVAALGFAGVTLHAGRVPADLDAEACERIRSVFERHGVRVVHCWAFGIRLVGMETELEAELELLDGSMRVANALGADAVIGGCGSLNPAGRYAPHPDNHRPSTRRRLVDALRRAGEIGAAHGVRLALEPHVLTTLESPERVRELVDAVDSPHVRVNLDPVNLVPDLASAYASTAFVERCLDVLGPVAVSGHVKDLVVENRFVLHIDETVPGDGIFDLATFVRLFSERLPGAFLFVEHVPAEDVPRAKAALDRIVAGAAAA